MKKVLNIIKNIFVWLVVLLAVCMMIFTIVSVNSFDRTDRDIFGYKAFIVRSDSMSATDFSAGDLILVKDENIVTYSFVLGKYQTKLPGVGKFFQFLKTTPGYIVCIFLPFLLLILVQGINSIRLFRQYKKEQLAELEAEREKERAEMAAERQRLEEQQAESQKMMAELLKLKNELSGTETPATESQEQPAEGETHSML